MCQVGHFKPHSTESAVIVVNEFVIFLGRNFTSELTVARVFGVLKLSVPNMAIKVGFHRL